MVFPTVHKVSADALFAAAAARGMRLIAGKVLMDRHAPDGLRDDVAQAERDCSDADRALARPRPPRLCGDGALRRHQHAGAAGDGRRAVRAPTRTLYMQTHVAENRDEVRWVARAVPARRAATSTSTRAHGLLHARAVLAHGIWLDDADRARAARRRRADRALPDVEPVPRQRPVRLARPPRRPARRSALASDVGGGTSLSMQRTLADAYKVQALARRAPRRPGRRCTPPRAAPAQALRPGRRDRPPRAGPHGRPVPVGLGRRPGGRRAATAVARELAREGLRLDDARPTSATWSPTCGRPARPRSTRD
ncbi:MAG: amidohydrolase family protein [Comamonadaceae bacterium]|nr:amidohydrolase family protein [Comamonadaceae bacterium]